MTASPRTPRAAALHPPVQPPAPFNAPGPNAYDPKLPFLGASAARGASMKHRAKAPMEDRLVFHECARTSMPRDPNKRFRARVTAK
jgi:hypothetical protein